MADYYKVLGVNKDSTFSEIKRSFRLKAKQLHPDASKDKNDSDDAIKMLAETDCDAIMIGRKAIGNPTIFSRVLARINGEEPALEDLNHRFDTMICYFKASVEYIGEEPACRMMRSRLGWFVRGMRNSSKFRESIKYLSSEREGIDLIKAYQDTLTSEQLNLEHRTSNLPPVNPASHAQYPKKCLDNKGLQI